MKFVREHSFLEKETILVNRNRHFSNAIKITSILNYYVGLFEENIVKVNKNG